MTRKSFRRLALASAIGYSLALMSGHAGLAAAKRTTHQDGPVIWMWGAAPRAKPASPAKAKQIAPAKPAPASPVAAIDPQRRVLIVDSSFGEAIEEIGVYLGLTIRVDADRHRRLRGEWFPLEKDAFIATLKRRFGAVVATDGDTLVVSMRDSAESRILPLETVSAERFKLELENAGLVLDSANFVPLPESNAVMINASAKVLGKAWAILRSVQSAGVRTGSELTIVRGGAASFANGGTAQNKP